LSLAEHVLRQWADHPIRGKDFVARHVFEARPAQWAPLPETLAPSIVAGLRAKGFDRLFSHQARALDAIKAGEDVVVATPTASGKSLIYNLATLNALAADPDARALYLFPTKALAHDQVAALDGFADACQITAAPHSYDGDTPADARRAIRRAARVVVTNPDMLHAGILPHHGRWQGLFSALRYVVLDEAHAYRGIFGSHVANVLRRLLRVCAFHGSHPQFVLSSATIANPPAHAEAIIGRPVTAITESGAPRGRLTFYVYNPPVVDGSKGIRGSYVQAARRVARSLAKAEVPTIVFANSRLKVERLTRHLQEDVASDGNDPSQVAGYRGGYLPKHRRAVEDGLRTGHVRTVVSTNALELGVDIGQLEACVLAGYPGSIASLWQRAGRAGRRQAPAVAVLIARSDPMDQYLAQHPDTLFGRSPEHARLQADHLLILADHMKCAAFELPFEHGEAFGTFGIEPTEQVLRWLGSRQILHPGQQRWHWTGGPYPAQGVGLRGIAEGNFTVLDTAHQHRIIGEVDYHVAASTLYPQAIYIVGGETYQVQRLEWDGRRALVEPVQVDYYTDSVIFEGVSRLDTFSQAQAPQHLAGHGEVRVYERVVGFKKIRFATGENVGYGEVKLPETELHTTALWFEPEVRLDLPRHQIIDALRGILAAIRRVAAVQLMCDPRDLGTALVDAEGAPERLPTLYVYERYPGGVGFHEHLFDHRQALLDGVMRILAGCDCEDGCPSCVGAPAIGEGRSRAVGQRVLRALATQAAALPASA
jgi:DEAD/DEAH box helicase domain-containing protein